MDPEQNIVPGSLWLVQTVRAEPPPFVPSIPMDDSDWNTTIIVHDLEHRVSNIHAERRHSGWAAVEKQWTQKNASSQQPQPPEDREPSAQAIETLEKLHPLLSLPPPHLEVDFRLRVLLNSAVATMAAGDGQRNWTTVTEGFWSGNLGSGTVVGGGQDSMDVEYGKATGTQFESVFKLRTNDEPPALIDCKARGTRTGPADVMRDLQASPQSLNIDPRRYRHRVMITMRTGDERYSEKVNFEQWVGTALWRGSEVVYDAYRVL